MADDPTLPLEPPEPETGPPAEIIKPDLVEGPDGEAAIPADPGQGVVSVAHAAGALDPPALLAETEPEEVVG